MHIKTRYKIGQLVDTKCMYTGSIKKNEIVGIYFDGKTVEYVFDHKTFILAAISEEKLIEIENEQKGAKNE